MDDRQLEELMVQSFIKIMMETEKSAEGKAELVSIFLAFWCLEFISSFFRCPDKACVMWCSLNNNNVNTYVPDFI